MANSSVTDTASSAYELVDVDADNEAQSLPPAFEDGTVSQSSWTVDEKRTSRLPPRPLKHKRPLWPFGVAFVLTFTTFFAFLFLLKYLAILKPGSLDEFPGSGAADASSVIFADESVSCDLAHKDGSTLQNAFLIDLRSPLQLSFFEAKLIDVVWDLIVGQGGRCLMAWISFRVFMDSLVALMEKAAVNYDIYTAVAFSTTSLWTLWESLRALFGLKGIRAKAFMLWFALAITYILAFPTLMGAATGYVNPSIASYNMGQGSWTPANSIKLFHCANVTRGSLIGLKDGQTLSGPPVNDRASSGFASDQSHNYTKMTSDFNQTYSDFLALIYPSDNTGEYLEVTETKSKDVFNATLAQLSTKYGPGTYTQTYYGDYNAGETICSDGHAFFGEEKPCSEPSFNSDYECYKPNCTNTYFSGSGSSYEMFNASAYPVAEISNTWYSNITFRNHTYAITNYSMYILPQTSYSYSTTHNIGNTHSSMEFICTKDGDPLPDSVKEKPQCIPKPFFVWGFSSLLLYIILPLQMAWTLGMFFVWLHAHTTSELLRGQRTVHGPLRAVADLAEAMKEVLGDEFCNYRDRDIRRELWSEGGNLRYYTRDGEDEDEVGHIGISSREERKLELKKMKLYGGVGSVKKRR